MQVDLYPKEVDIQLLKGMNLVDLVKHAEPDKLLLAVFFYIQWIKNGYENILSEIFQGSNSCFVQWVSGKTPESALFFVVCASYKYRDL